MLECGYVCVCDMNHCLRLYIQVDQKKNGSHELFITSTKIKQNNSNVFSLVDQDMLVNTMVPIFHAQNLLHILKKRKG